MIIPDNWFYMANMLTACFGAVYYFTHAMGCKKTDTIMMRIMVMVGFVVCGIAFIVSMAMLWGEHKKYINVFLFFSWFAVVASMPFLRTPRLFKASAFLRTAEKSALIEQPKKREVWHEL